MVRRIRTLTASYLAALDRPASPELQDRCERVAQLVVLGEEARRKALAGSVAIDDVVRIENASERARRQLGLDDRKPEPVHIPLREQLAREAAEAAQHD